MVVASCDVIPATHTTLLICTSQSSWSLNLPVITGITMWWHGGLHVHRKLQLVTLALTRATQSVPGQIWYLESQVLNGIKDSPFVGKQPMFFTSSSTLQKNKRDTKWKNVTANHIRFWFQHIMMPIQRVDITTLKNDHDIFDKYMCIYICVCVRFILFFNWATHNRHKLFKHSVDHTEWKVASRPNVNAYVNYIILSYPIFMIPCCFHWIC